MTTKPGKNPVNILEQIRKLSRDSGKQLSQGKSPGIKDFLSLIPEEGRLDLFANLISAEINFRRSKGDSPASAEYVKRFPNFKRQVRRAFFEPSVGSTGSVVTDGDDQTALRSPDQDADELAATFELPDASGLGDYELLGELGRGGMGVVYEARHTKTGRLRHSVR